MNPVAELARRPMRTVRAKDIPDLYAHPRKELARLADNGTLHRLAYGYYIVVPTEHINTGWKPAIETAAAAIATTIAGPNNAILMGLTAARMHGALPRARAVTTVAVPKQHAPIELTDRRGIVRFVKRATDTLDAERITTEVGPTLVTTPEQTVLDLAHITDTVDTDITKAIVTLYRKCDATQLRALATDQRKLAALRRAEQILDNHKDA
ncbi:type IV toxin-antitoxin system AbiEi family antitoxin domain-containing protein [Antrihabitans stalagmiti]|nr:type IV toxin-antitoxin system AbiEi family antitoxin [Antrihabitans stalagmiti]